MLDTWSSSDILYSHMFERMNYKLKAKLYPYDHDIYGFGNYIVKAWKLSLSLEQLGQSNQQWSGVK